MYRYIIFLFFAWMTSDLTCQIPVAEEPLHHIIYEDEEIRILEILAAPGDTSLMHQHDYNYSYIALSGGKMWLEDKGAEEREVNLPKHYIGGKANLSESPFVHRFANLDDHVIRFFTVESKAISPNHSQVELISEEYKYQSEFFAVSILEIAPKSACSLSHETTLVVLNLHELPLFISQKNKLKYWMRFAKKEPVRIQNMEDVAIKIVVFEIN